LRGIGLQLAQEIQLDMERSQQAARHPRSIGRETE
jgi:hypothetical protein